MKNHSNRRGQEPKTKIKQITLKITKPNYKALKLSHQNLTNQNLKWCHIQTRALFLSASSKHRGTAAAQSDHEGDSVVAMEQRDVNEYWRLSTQQ